jgi:hypothetical protein
MHRNFAEYMRRSTVFFALIIVFAGAAAEYLYAETPASKESVECQPTYGHYWRSSKWGWYGARKQVKTPVEARQIIEQVFTQNSNIKVIRITERPHYFIAEMINRKGVVVDLILIDRRTGRIRSMF